MKLFLLVMLFSFGALAAPMAPNPYCEDFKSIKKLMVKLDKERVDRILPYADWVDEQYRRQDRRQATILASKTIVLLFLKRLTPFAFVLEPTRMGDGTITGMYASNPEKYARFLQLEPQSACSYLSMRGSGADTLRDITHQLWVALDRARR
ncbi:MAG: hypothetical protein ACLGHN_09185 [Bacteriovoracia bacterium]